MPAAKRTYAGELERLEAAGLQRRLLGQEDLGPVRARIDGREAILFSGNDYLGLAAHPEVTAAAGRALASYGSSASASRLVSGNLSLYRPLEEKLAMLKGKEAALVFPSGYLANLGALSALAAPGDVIFMDRLNHASLYDGWRLSGAAIKRYRHNDAGHLETLLETAGAARRGLIVTDGVFSMDGDLAPLPRLKQLSEKYSCALVVDDAHGTGVIGPGGSGTAAHFGAETDLEIGTLSKAAGSLGGFVAGSREIINFLINKSRPFIFTTGLPPASLAAANASLKLFEREPWRQKRVLELAARARRRLKAAGFNVPAGFTPIIPLITGSARSALRLSGRCLERGVFIPAIRPPAVPKNSARLRMTVSAAHSDEELSLAIDVLTASAQELGII